MGKKSKILYWSCLVVNLICFILDMLPLPTNFGFFRISFALSLMLIGLLLFARAVSLKLDSSMFISILLFLVGLLNGVSYFGTAFFGLDINQLWPYYLFSIALASLVTGLYFKHNLQLKLFIFFLGFGLITLLFVQQVITQIWLFIVLLILWFVAYFVVNIIIAKKRGKNG